MKDKRKLTGVLSLAILVPMLLYIAGVIAQFMININAWKQAGSDYHVSPGLPSLKIADVVSAIFHFPEGLIAFAAVAVGVALLCVFGLRLGWGSHGISDRDRNLTISDSGSYGTAAFMDEREIADCFELTSARSTNRDILGMLPNGKVLTHHKSSRLNENWAICGASGTGKSRCISRNLIFQAARREESIIVTDCKSELYESMSEYLRDQGYVVKIFNLIEMEHGSIFARNSLISSERSGKRPCLFRLRNRGFLKNLNTTMMEN